MSQTDLSLAGKDQAADPETVLADRYGRTPRTHKRDRRILVIVAAAFAVVLGAWVVWGALDGDSATIEARDTAHAILDDHNVDVSFMLTAPPGSSPLCVVQAMNDEFTVVGWKLIQIQPGEQNVRTFTQRVKTTQIASTGLIKNCWLP